MPKVLHRFRCALAAALAAAFVLIAPAGHADPLPAAALPDNLRGWLPWALHEHPSLGCPQAADGGTARVCVWQASLELAVRRDGGEFRLEVEVFAGKDFVQLPGNEEAWPHNVRVSGVALPVVSRNGRPWVELPLAGSCDQSS